MNAEVASSRTIVHRTRWRVAGQVQGVGFRPTIYRLAQQHHLTGFVRNDSSGLVIEAQGAAGVLEMFGKAIHIEKPEIAVISDVEAEEIALQQDEKEFVIAASDQADSADAGVMTDLATCPDCLREMRDPHDRRRYHFGLINCTNCGPRYSILKTIPYDRPNTTMASFSMCSECRVEYNDPSNRRFHAQPTCCHQCGPHLRLVNPHGEAQSGDPIDLAVKKLLAGQILAIKGTGGYHLACRADNEAAVQKLRAAKGRDAKPFAILCASVKSAQHRVNLSKAGLAALVSTAAPIVLAPAGEARDIAPSVSMGSHRLGVMLANTPIHHLLFSETGHHLPPLVMTSGNHAEEPLVYDNADALEKLGPMCDWILWHDRAIEHPIDDSVVLDMGEGEAVLPIRRARGYVPSPLRLPEASPSPGLCLGGDLKNTVAVVRGDEVILSQHLGDLSQAKSYANFKKSIDALCDLFRVKPEWIAHDFHPQYMGTVYAQQLATRFGARAVGFQHHHAHAAAVLAENAEAGPALVVVCDGTGFGADRTSWGGELMAVSLHGFRRLGWLRPIRLPGGDAAAKETWRSALAVLFNAIGAGFATHAGALRVQPDQRQRQFIAQMVLNKTRCVESTSAGRLFDAAAAILGLSTVNAYEGQGPMALESAAFGWKHKPEPIAPLYRLTDAGTGVEVDLSPVFPYLIEKLEAGASVNQLAWLFHQQFCDAWIEAVLTAVRATGLICVGLSGGVFCNQLLTRMMSTKLREQGLHVLRHRAVPCNDGGLAYGQAVLAAARFSKLAKAS